MSSIVGSGALNGNVYGYFAVISYGHPTSFLEFCKGEAVGLFTGGSTDLQPFLMFGIVVLFLLLLLPHLSLPLSSTLISNALAPFLSPQHKPFGKLWQVREGLSRPFLLQPCSLPCGKGCRRSGHLLRRQGQSMRRKNKNTNCQMLFYSVGPFKSSKTKKLNNISNYPSMNRIYIIFPSKMNVPALPLWSDFFTTGNQSSLTWASRRHGYQ